VFLGTLNTKEVCLRVLALHVLERTRRKLLEMTAQKNNSTGIATFHMWWYQLTAGFEMKQDNLVWEKNS